MIDHQIIMQYICKKCGKEFSQKHEYESHDKELCNKSLEEQLEDLNITDRKLKYIALSFEMGGFHSALQNLGHECVMSCNINGECIKTCEHPIVDSTKINLKLVPYFDILCASFPCESFSKSGNIFFDICQIIRYHTPKYIVLENVRNLSMHHQVNTWNIIRSQIDELGYHTYDKPVILNTIYIGDTPTREQVLIMCKRKDMGILPILPMNK